MRKFIGCAMTVLASVFLLQTGVGLLVFTIPLLIMASHLDGKQSFCLFGSTLAIVVATMALQMDSIQGENLGILLLSILFPAMSITQSAIYVILGKNSSSVLRKLVLSSLGVLVIGLAFSLFLTGNSGEVAFNGLLAYMEDVLGVIGEMMGVEMNGVATLSISIFVLASVPMGMVLAGFPILIAENGMNKTDERWQIEFAYMKMPNKYFWLFILAWAVTLYSLMGSVPFRVMILSWNIAVGISLHYLVSGISILVSLFRRRNAGIPAGRIMTFCFIAIIIPGFGIFVSLALVLLGVLETWVKFR